MAAKETEAAKKAAPRPIPPKHEARAAELRAQGFNVWAKADGSLGWGNPKAKPEAKPAPAPEASSAAEDDGESQEEPKAEPSSSAVGAVVAVVVGVVGLVLAAVAVVVKLRRKEEPADA